MRKAPHWLAWPRQLQGRISQLYTGRAHLHSFLAKLDVFEYSHMCPLGDGPGTLEHYIHSCEASLPWREEVAKLFDGAHIPDWTIILQHQPLLFFALVDHTTLGTVAFTKQRQRRFRSVLPPGTADQPLAFWHPHQPPVMGKPMTFDAYAPAPPRITPIRAGPHSAWTAYHSPVFLDPEWRQSKGTAAPPARQPSRPSRLMTTLRLLYQYAGRHAILGPPPRRSARHRAVTPQSLRTGLPPGRPPDSSPMAGLRSSPV